MERHPKTIKEDTSGKSRPEKDNKFGTPTLERKEKDPGKDPGDKIVGIPSGFQGEPGE